MTVGEAPTTQSPQAEAAEYTPAQLTKAWVGAVAQSQELYFAAFDSWTHAAVNSNTWAQALTLAQRVAEQQVNPARSFRQMQAFSDVLGAPAAVSRAMLSATLDQTSAAMRALQSLNPPDDEPSRHRAGGPGPQDSASA